jgi:hypothetical protein
LFKGKGSQLKHSTEGKMKNRLKILLCHYAYESLAVEKNVSKQAVSEQRRERKLDKLKTVAKFSFYFFFLLLYCLVTQRNLHRQVIT